ncbi:MAG TPA: hypothetical protein DD713_08665 [Nitrospiraceae bacterium]|nr:hypothetical protein [Nitrospiraceae bacterium]
MSLEDAGYRNCWLAYFDILGFKKVVEEALTQPTAPNALFVIRNNYEDALSELNASDRENLHCAWFSDTFIIFTPDESLQSFINIIRLAENFFIKCIGREVPLRGALSLGLFSYEYALNKGIYLGDVLIDAYAFAEATDWIGFILTPYAIEKAYCLNFYPERNGYRTTYKHKSRNRKIPMKKLKDDQIVAFVPRYGRAHPLYPNHHPLTPVLIAMQRKAPLKEQRKYIRTINFFDWWYRVRVKRKEIGRSDL